MTCGETSSATRRLYLAQGFSRVTVRGALQQLAEAGWPHSAVVEWARQRRHDLASPAARVPAALLLEWAVGARARVLYGVLQLLPVFRHPSGWFAPADLAARQQIHVGTIWRAVRELASTGWLRLERANRCAPIRFTLCDPIAEARLHELLRVQRRLESAPFRGEALMRAYLDLLVASDEFMDDSKPGFLVNPLTGESLQFDRFYPPRVAFEFNGPQHYGATERFHDDEVRAQRARDLIKLGICFRRDIKLVVIHPEELNLQTMQKRVDGLLPLRDLSGRESVVEYLEAAGRRYLSTAPPALAHD